MCITFLYVNPNRVSGKFSVILIMNRDEYFKRPTSISAWDDHGVLAGRDQQPGKEGGTWLGMNKFGKIGLLTNIYTPSPNPGAGRGFLVIDYLREDKNASAKNYLKMLSMNKALYSPFNLLLLEPKSDGSGAYEAEYYCRGLHSCPVKDSVGPEEITDEIVGLSNHPLPNPYQKSCFGKSKFAEVVGNLNKTDKKEELVEKLVEILSMKQSHFPDDQMEKQAGDDSKMRQFHPKLASIFVDVPEAGYGTRVQTVILVDFDNHVDYIERSRNEDDSWTTTEHSFNF